VTCHAALRPRLDYDLPDFQTRLSRARRLNLLVRSSPASNRRRRLTPQTLRPKKHRNQGCRPWYPRLRPATALRLRRLASGSSPADPTRRVSSTRRFGVQESFSPTLQSALRLTFRHPSVSSALPAPRLAAGFGVRAIPAVANQHVSTPAPCAYRPSL